MNSESKTHVLLEDCGIEEVVAAAGSIDRSGDQTLAVCIAEDSGIDIGQLAKALHDAGIPAIGALFPGLIHGASHVSRGVQIRRMPAGARVIHLRDIHLKPDIRNNLLTELEDPAAYPTCMIFLDGLSAGISNLLWDLHQELGDHCRFLGGGAGSLTLQQKPCLFSGADCSQDSALLVFLPLDSSYSVRHGWQPLDGPFIATRTSGNILHELNWQPAFEVYRESIRQQTSYTVRPSHFFEDAQGFPFGMGRTGREDIVRDPLTLLEDGSLVCVGDVPENSVLQILCGSPDSLIEAGIEVVRDLSPLERPAAGWLIFDCVSRILYLKDDYTRELEGIQAEISRQDPEGVPLGVLTLGEIASAGRLCIEVLNKTLVVAALHLR
jgi:hypothetical protein